MSEIILQCQQLVAGLVVLALVLLAVELVALVFTLQMNVALYARGSTFVGRPTLASIGLPALAAPLCEARCVQGLSQLKHLRRK